MSSKRKLAEMNERAHELRGMISGIEMAQELMTQPQRNESNAMIERIQDEATELCAAILKLERK